MKNSNKVNDSRVMIMANFISFLNYLFKFMFKNSIQFNKDVFNNQSFEFIFKNLVNKMSEAEHQVHYKHPKIAKNTANKLPEAFLQSKTTVIIPKKIQQQKIK